MRRIRAVSRLAVFGALIFAVISGIACGSTPRPTPVPHSQTPTPISNTPRPVPTATPLEVLPPPTPTPTLAPVRPVAPPFQPVPTQTVPDPPDRDPLDLARRLRLKQTEPIKATPAAEAPKYAVGQSLKLWVLQDGAGGRQIDAVVRAISEHAVWAFDTRAEIDEDKLQAAISSFEERIWPAVETYFGKLDGPGLNGDTRMTIFHTDLDEGLAGYYSSSDEFPTSVHPFSNERRIIYIDFRKLALASETYLTVLAHELQHAVHSQLDPGEEAFLNEGLSELAVVRAGFDPQGPTSFLAQPNTQLNGWPDAPNTGPHYGASLLFVEYLVDHFGGNETIRKLVAQPADGLASIDAHLAGLGYKERAIDVFRDWVVANYLDEDESPYGYPNRVLGPIRARLVTGAETIAGQIAQMGAEYFVLKLGSSEARVRFEGEPATQLIPVPPKSLRTCWWGNRGDSIDPTLTREIDLTAVSSATLRYSVWYSIEDEWDYAYVEISRDEGKTWDILEGLHTTRRNSNGSAFGPGYTGQSEGWLSEQIDLTAYAGRKALLRFEYVTDDAVHRQGICFDDFEVREIGWFDFAESDRDWQIQGFARINDRIPQDWLVQIVRAKPGRATQVSQLPISAAGEGEAAIKTIESDETLLVIVSPVSPGSLSPAPFNLKVTPSGQRTGE
ncbi:MAG: immune inhibitor A [Chloroflexi bacterium]|nr:immune inhibitor A [Chloroflexota bacterium]